MKKIILLCLYLLLISRECFSQIDSLTLNKTDTVINIDASFPCFIVSGGYNNAFFGVIGFGILSRRPTKYLLGRDPIFLPKNYISGKMTLSTEILKNENEILFAPKICFTAGISFVSLSYCNFLYYTDFSKGSFSYRPEIGFNFGQVHIYYGYNIPISNKSFLEGYHHQIGLSCFFKVGKTKITTIYMDQNIKKERQYCYYE